MAHDELRTAPPPGAVALLVLMVAASALILANGAPPAPTLEDAGLAVDGASTAALGAARLAFALTHLGVLLALCLGPGVVVTTDFYKPELGSQLRVESFRLRGPERCFAFFTIWTCVRRPPPPPPPPARTDILA